MSGFTSNFANSGGIDLDVDTTLPSETLDELAQLAQRYPQPRSALLPMLHLVQSVEGRITPAGVEACAQILGITEAEVNGVATFYTMFKRQPVGKHHIGVCTTALCAIMGGDAIAERLHEHLGIGNNETTDDAMFTLEHVECNAACDFAPVVMVNWEFFDTMNPESTVELIEKLRAGEEVASPRGATITSWRDAERVLAGFADGRADEGPTAGLQSILGLKIAERHGWQAPRAAGEEAVK